MTTLPARSHSLPRPSHDHTLARLVGAIGEDCFGPALANHLHELCGADHFAAFHLGPDELREVAACCVNPARTARDRVESYVNQGWWRRDPAMTQAQRLLQASSPSIIHVDFSDARYADLRPRVYPHVRDRLLLCGRSADASFGLSVLAEIESCIEATSELPRREAEVCARILYGLSSVGISLDLSVTEETVKTYRKRAYQRLVIGSERELLTWYLACWSRWRGHRFEKPSRSVSAATH